MTDIASPDPSAEFQRWLAIAAAGMTATSEDAQEIARRIDIMKTKIASALDALRYAESAVPHLPLDQRAAAYDLLEPFAEQIDALRQLIPGALSCP